MLRSQRAALVVAGVLCTVLAAPAGAFANGGLAPGGVTKFKERVPVNVVFVGFDERDAPWNAVRSELSSRGEPIVRSRAFYGIEERLGLDYSYDYKPHYTSKAWEDGFFGYLGSIAVPKPITEWQQAYNDQLRNVLNVTDNRWIDAPKVEKRLIDTAPAGVDTRQPTIFFINWHGRQDFRFHVYSKTGEPDPDTGYDFGALRDTRKIVAWGGTTPDDEETGLGRRGVNRVWFYDLSAGPENWGGNFDVDDADLDGDGVADYRIPVSWEYGSYRPKSALPHDLGKVVRYVGARPAVHQLAAVPAVLHRRSSARAASTSTPTRSRAGPGVDASREFIDPGLFLQEERELPVGFDLTTDSQDLAFAGDVKRCFEASSRPRASSRASRAPGYPADANLFLLGAFNQNRLLEGDGDYEAASSTSRRTTSSTPLLGYADDNWLDGTQSGVFSFISPGIVDLGYGLTTTMIHEYGHHSSMSHPHDGYDPARGVDFEPTGDYFFAWLGDESNSIMSYIDVNWDFSQFDRDNSARHHAGGYALIANRIAKDVLRDRDARTAAGDLAAADRALEDAQDALEGHDYTGMLAHAAKAYRHVRTGAARPASPSRCVSRAPGRCCRRRQARRAGRGSIPA